MIINIKHQECQALTGSSDVANVHDC
jgi:hypothetical protein